MAWALSARLIRAFYKAGYDYVTLAGSDFTFPHPPVPHARSISQNAPGVITNRAEYEAYGWPDPDSCDYSRLTKLTADLPAGMSMIVSGPGGVLENVTTLLGYETLCLMRAEDPELLGEIFDAVGARILRYYEICLTYPAVGAIIVNDDWGFSQQTLLSPADMRHYVFPWHRKMVEAIHAAGRPAILHSCGNLREVWDDIIDDMKFDGKHSFEDKIQPVEEAYEQYGNRDCDHGRFRSGFYHPVFAGCHQSPR